jgi:hypothetical protein
VLIDFKVGHVVFLWNGWLIVLNIRQVDQSWKLCYSGVNIGKFCYSGMNIGWLISKLAMLCFSGMADWSCWTFKVGQAVLLRNEHWQVLLLWNEHWQVLLLWKQLCPFPFLFKQRSNRRSNMAMLSSSLESKSAKNCWKTIHAGLQTSPLLRNNVCSCAGNQLAGRTIHAGLQTSTMMRNNELVFLVVSFWIELFFPCPFQTGSKLAELSSSLESKLANLCCSGSNLLWKQLLLLETSGAGFKHVLSRNNCCWFQTCTLMRNNDPSIELWAEDGLGPALFMYLLTEDKLGSFLFIHLWPTQGLYSHREEGRLVTALITQMRPPHQACISSFHLSVAHRACFPQQSA